MLQQVMTNPGEITFREVRVPGTAENGSSFFKTCGDRAGEKDRKGLSGASSG